MRSALLAFVLFASAAAADNIEIGVIAPLTGGSANLGSDISRTLRITEELFNAQGRHKYRFLFEDGRCGIGDGAATAAQKLIHLQKVKFLITGCSGETMQTAPLAERERVVVIAVATSHPDAKHLGDFIFRTYLDIEDGVRAVSERMKNDGRKEIALLSEENAFTIGIKQLLEKYLGPAITSSQDYPAHETDLRSLLSRAHARKPDAFYFNCAGPLTCAAVAAQYRQLALNEPVYTYFYPEHPDVLNSVDTDGFVFFTVPDAESAHDEYRTVERTFRERHGVPPGTRFISEAAYDAARVLVNSIEANGPDPFAVKNYLYRYDAPGALGRIQFDENGDIRNIDFVLKKMQGKHAVTLNQQDAPSR